MKKIRFIIRNNFYFIRKAYICSPLFIIFSIFMRILTGIRTWFMQMFFLSFIISCIERGSSLKYIIIFIFTSFCIVSLIYLIESIFNNIYKPIQMEKISQNLQQTIFRKIRFTDMKAYDSEIYYTSIMMANNECSERIQSVLNNCFNIVESTIVLISIISYSLFIDWIVPIVAIVSFATSYIINQIISNLRVKYDADLQIINKETNMLHRILYLPEYAKDIRVSNFRNIVLERFHKKINDKRYLITKKGGKLGRLSALETILSSAFYMDFLVPLYLSYRILIQYSLFASEFLAIINGCNQLQLKLSSISENLSLFYQNGIFIERFIKVENMESEIETEEEHRDIELEDLKQLTFKNVYFNFENNGFGLKDINFTIKKGQKIAIVGKNGSGKSTLIKLLLRFYDTMSGSIELNYCNIKDININKYRKYFSTLFQDFQIYPAKIKYNIAMDTNPDIDKILNALNVVELNNLFKDLERELTKEFTDNGISFSGGQLQRLALARVIYNNHEILVLDEPTSAMDIKFEKYFYDLIHHYFKEKTIIFVSHRLLSIVSCDLILYMEDGRIVEKGIHSELLQKNGGYAELFKAQASLYNLT
jgi:ATP-binding cassette subfamily B protein